MRKEEKTRVRRELRRWRREGDDGIRYRRERDKYKKLCEKKKRADLERWMEEIKEARTEGQMWRIVNRERKRKKRVNEGIEMEEWDYFKELLGGVEGRVVSGIGREKREEGEEELRKEEVMEVIRKLKDGKAMGSDGIPNEVWKYGGEEVREGIWEV